MKMKPLLMSWHLLVIPASGEVKQDYKFQAKPEQSQQDSISEAKYKQKVYGSSSRLACMHWALGSIPSAGVGGDENEVLKEVQV
jgi:hypothetical protein